MPTPNRCGATVMQAAALRGAQTRCSPRHAGRGGRRAMAGATVWATGWAAGWAALLTPAWALAAAPAVPAVPAVPAAPAAPAAPDAAPAAPAPAPAARTEDVTFPGGAEGVELHGTLTLPNAEAFGPGPYPAVVLVTGSGTQDRDETITPPPALVAKLGPLEPKRPFADLAAALAARGLAVLRYDDRGSAALGKGKSTGDANEATTRDYADDAAKALAYAASRAEISPARVALLGHSEGGLVAAMLLAQDKIPGAAVLLAGPGTSGAEVIISQQAATLDAAKAVGQVPLDDAGIAKMKEMQRTVVIAIATGDQQAAEATMRSGLTDMMREQMGGSEPPAVLVESQVQAQLEQMSTPWMKAFLIYDPATDLATSKKPVLALLGERDTQVTLDVNESPLRAALAKAGHPKNEVRVIAGRNHLFQSTNTGLVTEYWRLPGTIDADVSDAIAAWLLGAM